MSVHECADMFPWRTLAVLQVFSILLNETESLTGLELAKDAGPISIPSVLGLYYNPPVFLWVLLL